MPVTTAAATARALGLWALSVGLAAAAPHKERKEPFAKEMGQAKGKIGEVTGSVTAFLTNTTVDVPYTDLGMFDWFIPHTVLSAKAFAAGFAGVMLGIFLFVGMCCWCCKKPSDEFEYEDDEGTALKDAAGGGGYGSTGEKVDDEDAGLGSESEDETDDEDCEAEKYDWCICFLRNMNKMQGDSTDPVAALKRSLQAAGLCVQYPLPESPLTDAQAATVGADTPELREDWRNVYVKVGAPDMVLLREANNSGHMRRVVNVKGVPKQYGYLRLKIEGEGDGEEKRYWCVLAGNRLSGFDKTTQVREPEGGGESAVSDKTHCVWSYVFDKDSDVQINSKKKELYLRNGKLEGMAANHTIKVPDFKFSGAGAPERAPGEEAICLSFAVTSGQHSVEFEKARHNSMELWKEKLVEVKEDLEGSSRTEVSTNSNGEWGVVMGMAPFKLSDAYWFEDPRCNGMTLWASADGGSNNGNRNAVQTRYFNSGERQRLIRAIVERVDWCEAVVSDSGDGFGVFNDEGKGTDSIYDADVSLSDGKVEHRDHRAFGIMKLLRDKEEYDGYISMRQWREFHEDVEENRFFHCDISKNGSALDILHAHDSMGKQPLSVDFVQAEDGDGTPKEGDEEGGAWRIPFVTLKLPNKVERRMALYDVDGESLHGLLEDDVADALRHADSGLAKFRFPYYVYPFELNDDYAKAVNEKWASVDDAVGREPITDYCQLGDSFPLHDHVEVAYLQKEWASFKTARIFDGFGRGQPLDEIAAYYGPEIGLYYAFMETYTFWFLPLPALAGVVIFAVMHITGASSPNELGYVLPVYSMCLSVLSTAFLDIWTRKENDLKHDWGTDQFEENESVRHQFRGQWDLEVWGERRKDNFQDFSKNLTENYLPQIVSVFVFAIFIFFIIVSTYIALLGKAMGTATQDPDLTTVTILGWTMDTLPPSWAPTYAYGSSIINLVLIMVLESLWSSIAPVLTNWENKRTETDFHDTLVFKLAIFQTMNYFAPLLYIAFLKTGTFPLTDIHDACMSVKTDVGTFPDCIYELEIQLFSIFVGKLAAKNAARLLVPLLGHLTGSAPDNDASEYNVGDTVYFDRVTHHEEDEGEDKKAEKAEGEDEQKSCCWCFGGSKAEGEEAGKKKVKKLVAVNLGEMVGEVVDKGDWKVQLRYKVPVDAAEEFGELAGEAEALGTKYKLKWVRAGAVRPHITLHHQMTLDTYKSFDLDLDYLEMVVQFGFMTLFAVAFPLAASFAFASNLLEIRGDASDLLLEKRRAVYKEAEDIGSWKTMLSGIASISVVTNAAIVGFVGTVLVQATLDPASILSMMQEEPFSTIDPEGNQTCMAESTTLAECVATTTFSVSPAFVEQSHRYKMWRLWMVVVLFEHGIFFITAVVAYAIPDVTDETEDNMHGLEYFRGVRGW